MTWLLRAVVLLTLTGMVAAAPGDLSVPDLQRIEELHHLSDHVGAEIFPGFDLREVPLAVNNADVAEFLIAHPAPPPEFAPWEGQEIGGKPVLRRSGCTVFGPNGGGWTIQLGGVTTAYVSTKLVGQATDDYLEVMLHEGFHVFQKGFMPGNGPMQDPPPAQAGYAAMLALEGRVLHAALGTPDEAGARRLFRMFLAVRRGRRRDLDEAVVRFEDRKELSEGTALYAQARVCQVLAATGGIAPRYPGADPDYRCFADASARLAGFVGRLLPPPGKLATFADAMYTHGMAQGLLLDRFHAGWKLELARRRRPLTEIAARACPVSAVEAVELLDEARARFRYTELLADQTAQANAWHATVDGYLNAPGRRFRVHHGLIEGRFKWQPAGPVYERDEAVIWAGGIRRFEKGPLTFASEAVPVIFTGEYLEWIDATPAAGFSDVQITHAALEGNVHRELTVKTEGFRLSLDRAVVELHEDVVDIRPVSPVSASELRAGDRRKGSMNRVFRASEAPVDRHPVGAERPGSGPSPARPSSLRRR